MKGKTFTIHEPVYESNCTVDVGVPFEDVLQAIERASDPAWFEDNKALIEGHRFDAGFCLQFKGTELFGYKVWVKDKWACDSICLLTLTHEVLHLVMSILETRGTPIERSNDEVICRMQSFYLRKCLWKLLDKPRKVAA